MATQPDPTAALAALGAILLEPLLLKVTALEARVAQLSERLATRPPEPLVAILGGSPSRCRMIETRDDGLRALAVQVGGRRLYDREQVLQYMRGRVERRRADRRAAKTAARRPGTSSAPALRSVGKGA